MLSRLVSYGRHSVGNYIDTPSLFVYTGNERHLTKSPRNDYRNHDAGKNNRFVTAVPGKA